MGNNLSKQHDIQRPQQRQRQPEVIIQRWWRSIPKQTWECHKCLFVNKEYITICKVCNPKNQIPVDKQKHPSRFSQKCKLHCRHCFLLFIYKTRHLWKNNTSAIATIFRLNSPNFCQNMPNNIYEYMLKQNSSQLCDSCCEQYNTSQQRALVHTTEALTITDNDYTINTNDCLNISDYCSQLGLYWTAERMPENTHQFKFATNTMTNHLQSIDNEYEKQALILLNKHIVCHIAQLQ
jgi:hypothetical protein